MLKLITDDEVAAVLRFADVAVAIEQAFDSLARGGAAIKARTRADCGAAKLSSMGALWPDVGLAGEKVYATVAGRFQFLFTLFDLHSGMPLAVMQAAELTRFRTAALTMLAVKRGAASTRSLALFGAGLQGRSHVEALLGALPFERVAVVDTADVSAWCEQASRQFGVKVYTSEPEAAVRGADVVVTLTRSKQPVFDGRWLAPGTFVAAIGTSLPDGRELDDTALSRAARIVVEWKPQSCMEAGEIVLGLRTGAVDDSRVVDLVQLFSAKAPWRSHADEILVFKSVGVGLTDLAAASLVWRKLSATG